MDSTISVVEAKLLISCTVTIQLICVFVVHMQKGGFLMTRHILQPVIFGWQLVSPIYRKKHNGSIEGIPNTRTISSTYSEKV